MKSKDFILWELFFEKILNNLDAFVAVADPSGRVVFSNKKFRLFFGDRRKTPRKDIWDMVSPSRNGNDLRGIFAKIKQRGIVTRFVSPVRRMEKLRSHFLWLSIPLRDGKKEYYFFMGKKNSAKEPGKVVVHSLGAKELSLLYKQFVDDIFEASMISEPETASHAARVMQFSMKLAKKMKLGKNRIENLKAAALLHDIGKLAVKQEILFKKGRLNEKEFAEIKKHPFWAAQAIKTVYFLHDIVPIMLCHHEHYNGKGYPDAIRGEDIPVESRILSVADVYEALIADRPYRKGYPKKKAMEIMEHEKGTKLDPRITDIFLGMVRSGKIKG